MVVVVFRARIRPEFKDEYYALADRMAEIARSLPGFISWKGYHAEDGERVSIHEWETPEQLRAWREHPEHLNAQALASPTAHARAASAAKTRQRRRNSSHLQAYAPIDSGPV
jgi:heme-degrading monooxygenase HmoA